MKNSSKPTANPTGPCDDPFISIPLVGEGDSKTVNHETPNQNKKCYFILQF